MLEVTQLSSAHATVTPRPATAMSLHYIVLLATTYIATSATSSVAMNADIPGVAATTQIVASPKRLLRTDTTDTDDDERALTTNLPVVEKLKNIFENV
ncbi:hypothetical protein ON010_g14544 [Phytophthora cinnamomi]|nr:hypothetical protein ON010_g14544 [Phytophthora cinnamomi]